MKKVALTLLFALLLTAPSTSSTPSNASRALAATVIVLSDSIKCSGFAIGPQTILTAAHCVDAEGPRILAYDEKEDIAVLSDPNAPEIALRLGKEPVLGETVQTFGYPRRDNSWPLMLRSTVAATASGYRPERIRNIFHDGVKPGMSGGPIVAQNGTVVGLISEVEQSPGSVILVSPTVKQIRKLTMRFWGS